MMDFSIGRSMLIEKNKKNSRKHVLLQVKDNVGNATAKSTKFLTYKSEMYSNIEVMQRDTEYQLETASIIDLYRPAYCRFYLFDISGIKPNEKADATPYDFSISTEGNIYTLRIKKDEHKWDAAQFKT